MEALPLTRCPTRFEDAALLAEVIDLLAQVRVLARLLALGGQGGALALPAARPGELQPAASDQVVTPGSRATLLIVRPPRISAAAFSLISRSSRRAV